MKITLPNGEVVEPRATDTIIIESYADNLIYVVQGANVARHTRTRMLEKLESLGIDPTELVL